MKAATHAAFAGVVGVTAAGFGAHPGMAGAGALLLGALLPDIDTAHSGLGRWVTPVSRRLERRFGHRTLTHSLLGTFIVGCGLSWLLLLNPAALVWLLIGYLSHLLLDTANVSGIPLLWPWRLQFWLVGNRAWRVPYGSPQEFIWFGVFCALGAALTPLSVDGFNPWFHRLFPTPYGAVSDYLRWADAYEVFAAVNGQNLLTREAIEGERFRVIDAPGRETLLVEDAAGRAYTVGLSGSDNIHSPYVRVYRGAEIAAPSYRLDLSGRLVRDLIAALPKGANRVYVTAELETQGTAELPPVLGYYRRVEASSEGYTLRSATVGDLQSIAGLAIREGSAVVRAEYDPDSPALENLALSTRIPKRETHVLSIPDLPSLAGLVVEVGDHVEEGQLLARYVDDAALAEGELEVQGAKARLPVLKRQIVQGRKNHETKLRGIRDRLKAAETRLGEVRFLVASDALPRARAVAAADTVARLEQAEQEALTAWTSKLSDLQEQVQAAQLSIRQTEAAKQQTAKQQWVKSPVAGLVADIRVVKVAVDGVTLEVLIDQGTTTK